MRMKPSLRALAVGVAVAGMMCVGGGAYAVTSITSSPAINVTGPDHERLTITLAPGASRTFELPAANDPLRIDLDAVSVNGGIQTPSEVFSALLNVDANRAGMSWIGTRSNASQTSGYTFNGGPTITELTCGANCVIAWLNSGNAADRTVTLKQNANTTSIRRTYVINIWY
jgi:hypothetical protein